MVETRVLMHFFIIPGNPPAIHFYKLWAEEIKKEFPESFITISSYPHLPVSHDSFEYFRSKHFFGWRDLRHPR